MALMSSFVDKFSVVYQWFRNFNNNKTAESGVKRKSSLIELDENISPKRFKKNFNVAVQTDHPRSNEMTGLQKCIFNKKISSTAEKIQLMNQSKPNYFLASKFLRPPRSWNMNVDPNVIEFSSDDDDDNNDLRQINDVEIIEGSSRNRNPLASIQKSNSHGDCDVEVVGVVTKKNNMPLNGTLKPPTFHTSTPTPVSESISHRKNSHTRGSSSNGIIRNSSVRLKKPSTMVVIDKMDSKEKYKSLLMSFIGVDSPFSTPATSFENLSDVEKKVNNSNYFGKKNVPHKSIQVIDLTESRVKRKPTHLSVKPSYSKHDDVEVVKVVPVPPVNFPRGKVNDCKYSSPQWLEVMKASLAESRGKIEREAKEQKKIKNLYSKSNQATLDAVGERALRYMSITDDHVLEIEEKLKLPELTAEMDVKISAALVPRPSHEVVAEGFSLKICRKDMHTLANLNWLNDEVINFYMNLLIERGKQGKLPKVYAFNTFFYPTLVNRGYSSLRRWTRKIDIFSHDLIVVPVHLGVHWCMAIIDFRHQVIEYYDSMGNSNNKCLGALVRYLQDESKDKKNIVYDTSSWKTINMTDIPQQMNGSDCGMFACTFAEYKCRNANIDFTQADMPYFRRKMVYEIIIGHLMIGFD